MRIIFFQECHPCLLNYLGLWYKIVTFVPLCVHMFCLNLWIYQYLLFFENSQPLVKYFFSLFILFSWILVRHLLNSLVLPSRLRCPVYFHSFFNSCFSLANFYLSGFKFSDFYASPVSGLLLSLSKEFSSLLCSLLLAFIWLL